MTTTTEPVEDVAQESSDTAAPLSHPTPTAAKEPRAVSIRLSTVLVAAGIAALLALSVTFGVLYASASSELSDRDATAADDRHAEQIATDYALGASTIDYHDVKAWLGRLQAGTTPNSRPNSKPPHPSSNKSCCHCNGPPRPPPYRRR